MSIHVEYDKKEHKHKICVWNESNNWTSKRNSKWDQKLPSACKTQKMILINNLSEDRVIISRKLRKPWYYAIDWTMQPNCTKIKCLCAFSTFDSNTKEASRSTSHNYIIVLNAVHKILTSINNHVIITGFTI